MAITASLTTVIRNMRSKTTTFACLPRSKRLTPGQEYTFDGDLLAALQGNRRKLAGLNRALAEGWLAIVKTPSDHFYDATRDETKVLGVDGGSVTVNDPSWGQYSSSIDGAI